MDNPSEDLFDLFESWIRTNPKVRGYEIEDAELGLRPGCEGWIAVWIRLNQAQSELQDKHFQTSVVTNARTATAKDAGESTCDLDKKRETLEEIQPAFPAVACARFKSYSEIQGILTGEIQPTFLFADEMKKDVTYPLDPP